MKIDLDFAVSYRALERNRGGGGGSITYMITVISILVAVIIAGILGFFVIVNINDTIIISKMRTDVSEFEIQKAQITASQKALEIAEKKQATMIDVNSIISSHRALSKKEIEEILSALDKGVRVAQMTYSDSVLQLQCKTESVYAPSNSAENLEKIGVTAVIDYNGFTYEDLSEKETNDVGEIIIIQADPLAPKTYIFELTCYVNAEETAVK